MIRKSRWITIIFIAICTLVTVDGLASESVTLSLFEYPPLMGRKVKNLGIAPSIVRAAFNKVGIDIKFEFYPPARAFATARVGSCDGAVGWVYSEERAKLFLYSDPYFEAPLVFFHLKEKKFDWNNVIDLQGARIGITLRNFYGVEFHKAIESGLLIVDSVPKDELQFEKLLRGRIDLIPLSVHVGLGFILQKYGHQMAELFTYHPKPLKISQYHILFSRKHTKNIQVIEKFNHGLKLLKSSKEYEAIIKDFTER